MMIWQILCSCVSALNSACRAVGRSWKSRGDSNLVGIICCPLSSSWNRVNWSSKLWCGEIAPPSPKFRRPWLGWREKRTAYSWGRQQSARQNCHLSFQQGTHTGNMHIWSLKSYSSVSQKRLLTKASSFIQSFDSILSNSYFRINS